MKLLLAHSYVDEQNMCAKSHLDQSRHVVMVVLLGPKQRCLATLCADKRAHTRSMNNDGDSTQNREA